MNKKSVRLLAMFLSICLCISLLPVTPVRALTNGSIADDAITETLTDDFSGIVVTYNYLSGATTSGGDAVRLDIATHTASAFKAFDIRIVYDPNVVILGYDQMDGTDIVEAGSDYYTYAPKAAKIGDATEGRLLTAKGLATSGIGAGKLTADSFIINGTGEDVNANALFKLNGTPVIGSATSAAGMNEVQLGAVVSQDNNNIKNYYEGYDASANITLSSAYKAAHGTTLNIFSLYFEVKSGQTVTDTTFGLEPGAGETFSNGVRLLNAAGSLVSNKAAFIGFPAESGEITFQIKDAEGHIFNAGNPNYTARVFLGEDEWTDVTDGNYTEDIENLSAYSTMSIVPTGAAASVYKPVENAAVTFGKSGVTSITGNATVSGGNVILQEIPTYEFTISGDPNVTVTLDGETYTHSGGKYTFRSTAAAGTTRALTITDSTGTYYNVTSATVTLNGEGDLDITNLTESTYASVAWGQGSFTAATNTITLATVKTYQTTIAFWNQQNTTFSHTYTGTVSGGAGVVAGSLTQSGNSISFKAKGTSATLNVPTETISGSRYGVGGSYTFTLNYTQNGANLENIDMRYQAAPTYTIFVKDNSDTPISGATVTATVGGSPVTFTDNGDGSYTYQTNDTATNVTVTASNLPAGYGEGSTTINMGGEDNSATITVSKVTSPDRTVSFRTVVAGETGTTITDNITVTVNGTVLRGTDGVYTYTGSITGPSTNLTIAVTGADLSYKYSYSNSFTQNFDGTVDGLTTTGSGVYLVPVVRTPRDDVVTVNIPIRELADPKTGEVKNVNVTYELTGDGIARTGDNVITMTAGSGTFSERFIRGVRYTLTLAATGYNTSSSAIYITVASVGDTVTLTPEGEDPWTAVEFSGTTATFTRAIELAVLTDPVYQITGTVHSKDETGYDKNVLELDVKLMNIKPNSGVIGLYFDKDVFKKPEYTTTPGTDAAGRPSVSYVFENVAFPKDNGTAMFQFYDMYRGAPSAGTNQVEIGDDYILFGWSAFEGANVTDGMTIFTLTLEFKDDFADLDAADLRALLDDHSVYTQSYMDTTSYTTNKTSFDNGAGKLVWREVDWKGEEWEETYPSDNETGTIAADDNAAQHGGFYRVSESLGNDNQIKYRDVIMKITINEVSKKRIEFVVRSAGTGLITDANYVAGKPVVGAIITVYDKDGNELEQAQVVKTDDKGYAYVQVPETGDYYFSIDNTGYWAYPDGTANTDFDNWDKEAVTIGTNDNITIGTAPGTNTTNTRHEDGVVYVIMNPMTFHEVTFVGDNSSDAGTYANVTVITDNSKAYNEINYYFALQLDAGKEWKNGSEADAATEMTVTVYRAEQGANTVKYHDTEVSPLPSASSDFTVKYDSATGMFYFKVGSEDALAPIEYDDPETEAPADNSWTWMRAGDFVITINKAAVQDARYTVSAIAGTGGTVAYTLGTGESWKEGTTGTDPQSKTVVLKSGSNESQAFTFTPSEHYSIGKVIINGVDETSSLSEHEKTVEFVYTFSNVSSDQTIYVTFLDEDGNDVSNPAISLKVGDNGKAKPGAYDDLIGDASGLYVVNGTSISIVITPDADFEIDKLLVDDEDRAAAVISNNRTLNITGLKNGQVVSVVVTFKSTKTNEVTQFVITSTQEGSGVLAPLGKTVVSKDTTPIYTIEAADNWKIKSIKLDGEIIYLDGETAETANHANSGTVTLPKVTKDMTLEVVFVEIKATFNGIILLDTDTAGSTDVVAPIITFTSTSGRTEKDIYTNAAKTDDNAEVWKDSVELGNDKVYDTDGETVIAYTVTSNQQISFTVSLPVGTYTVTITKGGYLDYTIEGFEVFEEDLDKTLNFGRAEAAKGNESAAGVNIKLLSGHAYYNGKAITRADADVVVAGWVKNPTDINKERGNIDESKDSDGNNTVTVRDMALVQLNMGLDSDYSHYTTYANFIAGTAKKNRT